jgi:hypothetical protein
MEHIPLNDKYRSLSFLTKTECSLQRVDYNSDSFTFHNATDQLGQVRERVAIDRIVLDPIGEPLKA